MNGTQSSRFQINGHGFKGLRLGGRGQLPNSWVFLSPDTVLSTLGGGQQGWAWPYPTLYFSPKSGIFHKDMGFFICFTAWFAVLLSTKLPFTNLLPRVHLRRSRRRADHSGPSEGGRPRRPPAVVLCICGVQQGGDCGPQFSHNFRNFPTISAIFPQFPQFSAIFRNFSHLTAIVTYDNIWSYNFKKGVKTTKCGSKFTIFSWNIHFCIKNCLTYPKYVNVFSDGFWLCLVIFDALFPVHCQANWNFKSQLQFPFPKTAIFRNFSANLRNF